MVDKAKCPDCGHVSSDIGIERKVIKEFSLEDEREGEHIDYGDTIGYFCMNCGTDFPKGFLD